MLRQRVTLLVASTGVEEELERQGKSSDRTSPARPPISAPPRQTISLGFSPDMIHQKKEEFARNSQKAKVATLILRSMHFKREINRRSPTIYGSRAGKGLEQTLEKLRTPVRSL